MSVKVDLDIAGIVEDVAAAMKPGLRAVAEEIARVARATSTFADKTGELRESITVKDPGQGMPFMKVRADAPHAHLIEFDHAQVTPGGRVVGHTPAHPFLRPAAEEVLSRANEIAARAMDPVDIKRIF